MGDTILLPFSLLQNQTELKIEITKSEKSSYFKSSSVYISEISLTRNKTMVQEGLNPPCPLYSKYFIFLIFKNVKITGRNHFTSQQVTQIEEEE